jgi:NADH-quinone oxidoreductase subunit J
VLSVGQVSLGVVTGLDKANAAGNVPGLAQLLFSRYVFAFEATSALLVTAAVGAMVLAHRERLTPKLTQADLAARRMRDYAERGLHPGPLPSPGVFARHNAVDTPALLPDGTPSEISVSRTLQSRGTVRTAPSHDIDRLTGSIGDGTSNRPIRAAGPRGGIDGDPSEHDDAADVHHDQDDQRDQHDQHGGVDHDGRDHV